MVSVVIRYAKADDAAARDVAVTHADRGIVVSGDPGSGKTTFVELLSAEYGKKVYTVEMYWREKYEEEHPNGGTAFEDYLRSRSERDQFKANVSLRHYAEDLGYIVDTKYTSIFDKDRCLVIYLHAPLEMRAMRLASIPEYSGKTIEDIKAILMRRQEDEVAMGKRLFGVDYRDRNLYNLILDSGLLTPEEELVAAKAKMRKLMDLARK